MVEMLSESRLQMVLGLMLILWREESKGGTRVESVSVFGSRE